MANFTDLFKGSAFTVAQKAKKALEWFKFAIKGMTSDQRLDASKSVPSVSVPELGKMYFFMYHDPKYKDTLPYYDLFPLVFPIEYKQLKDGSGFMGINLHYLAPTARAILLDALVTNNVNNDKYDDTTRIRVTYDILKSFSGTYPGFENCIKLYYFSRVKGQQFYYIRPSDWGFVVMLPLQQWVINKNRKYAGSPPY